MPYLHAFHGRVLVKTDVRALFSHAPDDCILMDNHLDSVRTACLQAQGDT